MGQLIRYVAGSPAGAAHERTLLLAEMIESEDGSVQMAALDEEAAPRALTDIEGNFAFTDIEPGFYALIIKTPISVALAHDVVDGEDIVVEVTSGEVTDLGEVRVNLPF